MDLPIGAHFKFDGRLDRTRFAARYGIPYLVLGALPGLFLPHGSTQVLLETVVLVLFLPGISRRLHDVDRSLWWAVVLWAIYGLVLAVQTTGMFGPRRSLAILLAGLPMFLLVLLLFFLPGTNGPNRYGGPGRSPASDSGV